MIVLGVRPMAVPIPEIHPEFVRLLVCESVQPVVTQPELPVQVPETVLVLQPAAVEAQRTVLIGSE